MMWNHLPVRSLMDMQRQEALEDMGQKARELLADGYAVDADRMLDELNERRRSWAA